MPPCALRSSQAKWSFALLARHETLDALYAHLAELPARQAAALRAHQARVWLNRRLVTIVTTVDVLGVFST